jgi:hypothetical protein
MDPPVHPVTSEKTSPHPSPNEDDDTVVTPTRGERVKPKERTSVEKTLKFRFVPSRNNDSIHPAILHAHWMHEVTMAFGGDQVLFLDNRNRQVTKIEGTYQAVPSSL